MPVQSRCTTFRPEIIPTRPACKILWLRDHELGIFNRAHKYLLVEDYLLHIQSGKWWAEMFDFIGLRRAQLPGPVRSGQAVGCVTEDAVGQTGLSPKTRVVTGAVGSGNIVLGIVSVGVFLDEDLNRRWVEIPPFKGELTVAHGLG